MVERLSKRMLGEIQGCQELMLSTGYPNNSVLSGIYGHYSIKWVGHKQLVIVSNYGQGGVKLQKTKGYSR